MNFIDKLERRFGRLGVPNLMKYVIALNILGVVLGLVNINLYLEYLSLDIYKILHGQVWRLVTFVLYPAVARDQGFIVDLIWFAVWAFVYYQIGMTLERMWGTFRFNLFYFGGVFFVIVATFIYYFVTTAQNGLFMPEATSFYMRMAATLEYLNQSLFLAFALMFPDVEFLVYFIIPVKAKWLSAVYLLLNGYQIVVFITKGQYYFVALIVGSLLNIALFYVFGRGKPGARIAYRQKKRRVVYKKQTSAGDAGPGARHRCAICGRTEQDAPNLEFRYCSKCVGNYEYCSDHLFTHEHVKMQ